MTAPPVIPDHMLLRPIGRGAYGEVWLARNVMGGLRAVKIIRREQFESERPYEREFAGIQQYEPVSRTSGGLVHVLHVGRNDAQGYFYYVMELADAAEPQVQSLRSKVQSLSESPATPDKSSATLNVEAETLNSYAPRTLRSDLKRLGRLPTGDCLRLAFDVVSGLAQLHRRQLVHRDVKPGNIIYVSGRAKLADIGLVTASGEGRTFVGTEGYIPPEGPGSPAADLYALGVALYEASTGRAPEQFPDVPGEWFTDPAGDEALELHEVILKACEGQRERRYRSADEMQADLALLQSGRSVRHVRALERRYARLRLAGVVGTALLVCTLVGLLFANYRARVAAENQAKEAALRKRAEAAERGMEQQLYTALLEQARATVLSGELGQRFRALDAVRRAGAISNSAALRGAAVSALALPDLRFEREWPIPSDVTLVQLDPAFERIALCREDGPVEIRAISDQRLLATLPASTNRPAYVGRWSPDGRFLTVKRDHDARAQRTVEVWDVAAARRILLLQDVSNDAVAFHPRLPRLMVGALPSTAAIWDLGTRLEVARHRIGGEPALVQFSPDGELFAALHSSGQGWAVTVHRADDGTPRMSRAFAEVTPDFASDFGWHPTGRWIAVSDRTGAVHLIDARTGETRVLGRHKAAAVVTVFSPDGRYLFTGGWDREQICWDMKTMLRAFTIGLDSYRMQIRADGRQCAILRWPEARLQLHAFEEPVLYREFAEDLGGGRNCATFSSDGRWLAACGGERLAVWDFASDGPGTVLSEPYIRRVAFAPHGELFASGAGAGFRWRLAPGTNSEAPVKLERLDLANTEGLVSLCVVSNGVVFTGAHGSKLAGFEQLATESGAWQPTTDGLNGASPDGRWLGMFRSWGSHLYIHRLPGLERVAKLTHQGPIGLVEFSPVGGEVAMASGRGVEFWSTTTWQRTRHLPNFTAILYSPDARTFWLSTVYRSAGLYDARTTELLLPLPPGTIPLAVSSDGRRLAASVEARRVQVWDLAEVRERLRALGLDWASAR